VHEDDQRLPLVVFENERLHHGMLVNAECVRRQMRAAVLLVAVQRTADAPIAFA
jgi:hypothetical protein